MKKNLLLFLLCFAVQYSFGQKEANIWYFGYYAGLDFNSGAPVPINNGQIATFEGCASVSDPVTGQILIYSDGITVWDKNHNPMPSTVTTPLQGDASSTQSAVIVPKPGSTSLYYIFTTSAQVASWSGQSPSMCYSIVDLSLNGGNGDVTTSNVVMIDSTTEKIAVVGTCNKSQYWVVGHRWNCDSFYAFKLTAAGLAPPVKTAVGMVHNSPSGLNNEAIGYMKFSPNGRKLGLVTYMSSNTMELFDFDFATGTLSNPITDVFPPPAANDPFAGLYGCSFSPDNTRFYVSYYSSNSAIFQYNMQAGSAAAILASKTSIGPIPAGTVGIGALQNAPDGKMYIANFSSGELGVINDPNALGNACNLSNVSFSLAPGTSTVGLPCMVENFLSGTAGPSFTVPSNLSMCKGNSLYSEQPIMPNYIFIPDTGFVVNNDSTGITFSPSATTQYAVIAEGACGSADTVKFTITVSEGPIADFSFDPAKPTTATPTILLKNESYNATTYEWKDSINHLLSTDVDYSISNPGKGTYCYTLTAYDTLHCKDTARKCITIEQELLSTIFIPNAFSPNGDGNNDEFKINGINIQLESFMIFNRFGEKVFYTNDINRGWNGTFSSEPCDVGTYFYQVKYMDSHKVKHTLKNDVVLIR